MLTGERTLPGVPEENYWFRRHEAAYRSLAPFTTGAILLEAGCGEGYGATLLAEGAGLVVGLDYDAATVRHVGARYPTAVHAVRGDLQRLPLRGGVVEVVVSLQTVEHLHDQVGFVRECARVLRVAGTLALSTPNRLTFSPGGAPPVNPFHTRELAPAELDELIAPFFHPNRRWGLRHGRRLRQWERRHGPLVTALLTAPPPAWPPELRDLALSVTAEDFDVDEKSRADSLDLITVAVRR